MKEIKRLYLAYKNASVVSDMQERMLEIALDKDDEHIDWIQVDHLTEEFDKTYWYCFRCLTLLIAAVQKYTGIDEKTVRKMVHTKEFENLVNRIA